ncbi:hypothetical protein PsorP6_001858 [Peronosclerospora sorghi]|uniref:Uncharacterized protein n=1 Tax=Peronosclerospora sorghi TaxID=230839 RepID=A0ACC0WWW1_9STRA|nr:hypothetical protein PsorP6_001858 [Peronosclerospora sorghi]
MGTSSLFQVGQAVEFWRVLIHLSLLAFGLVLFEKGLHRMEHQLPHSDKYQHMVKKVYRELMVLGLISLGLKMCKETPFVNSESKTILAFQVADLTVFILALVLVIQSTALFQLLRNQNLRADEAELLTTQDLIDVVKESDVSMWQRLCWCGRAAREATKSKKLVELRLVRRLFLRRFGFPQLFPYAKYLSRAQTHQISHMIEVEPYMWFVLLAVAWGICGILNVLEALDHKMPERDELVVAFMIVAWIILLLHIMVFLFFRSCVSYLLHVAAFNDDKSVLIQNLSAIVEEETKALQNEEADKALEMMSRIQEEHEEIEFQRVQRHRKLQYGVGGMERLIRRISLLIGLASDDAKESGRIAGVVPGSPVIDLHFFSYRVWHVSVLMLLVLNGFLITLFVQCAVYDLKEIYRIFGVLPTILVPLPLVLNAVFFQRHIFYDFVIVSCTLRIESHTLSDVVENFSEVVRLRSEFASMLLQHMTQQELSPSDLQDELEALDPTGSGVLTVDELRTVLSKFGFHVTRFRFNSVVKLLFELEGTNVSYHQVLCLVAMAQQDHGAALTQSMCHPLLRPSTAILDAGRRTSNFSQANYALYASTRPVPAPGQPHSGMAADHQLHGLVDLHSPNSDPTSYDFLDVPPMSSQGPHASQVAATGRYSSQAVHEMFNLQRASEARARR